MNQPQPNPAQEQRNALRQAVATQQQMLTETRAENAGLRHRLAKADLAIDFIAKMAGLTEHIAAIRTKADALNPAQPIPDPPGQAPSETTEQAATPEAMDNPLIPGQTPGSVQNLPADATGTPMDPGTTLPTAPYTNLQDVTAPVEGTQTHVPNDQTRTEVDVRVGDPMNPQRAFPWNNNVGPDAMGAQSNLQQTAAQTQGRTMASIRLARLQVEAGLAAGSDLEIAAGIEANASISDADIAQEISILERVKTASGQHQASQRPAAAVPQRAASQVGRTSPSLVQAPGHAPMQATAASGSVDADMENADLFD